MNAIEYRTLHGRKVQECTWCGKDTGHKVKLWCEGTECLKAFIQNVRIQTLETTKKAPREYTVVPERWHVPYDDQDIRDFEAMKDEEDVTIAQRMRRTQGGIKYCRRMIETGGFRRIRAFRVSTAFSLDGHGKAWAPEEDQELIRLKGEGWGYKRLRWRFRRTRDSIRSRWRELRGQGRDTRRGEFDAR